MSNARTGQYGTYYGSYYNESEYLSTAEKETNARYIYSYLTAKGWSLNAVAGLLGNMENESALNPGRWEGNDVGNGPGYGLVQWTPFTKYTEWCISRGLTDPSEMDNNLARILYEIDNNTQYYSTDEYPLSFREFTKSTKDPYYLACAFAWNYERSAVVLWGTEVEQEALRQLRGGDAEKWYSFLSGQPVVPGGGAGAGTSKKKKGLPLMLLYLASRRKV